MIIKNVCKDFKKGKNTIKVLINVNYSFEPGKMYAIFGQSGSGKTTLINILGLLEKPTSGDYIFNGINTSNLNKSSIDDLRKNNIGCVFQNIELNDYLTAIENVELPMLINQKILKENRKKIAEKLLKKLELVERANHYPHELSGGERQRVCIARALVNNPKVILCDEPTSSLDKLNSKKVFNILKQLANEGYCVIIATHDENIFKYANISLELKNGVLCEVHKK